MKLNKKMLIITLITILAIGLVGCVNKNVEGLVAQVNGEDITKVEFDSDFEVYKNQFESQLGEGALDQIGQDGKTYGETLKENIIEKLVMEKLVAKECKDLNISVSDDEVNEQMDIYLTEMGGQEKFDEFLDSIKLSKEFFEENLRKELLFEKYKEAILEDADIKDEDIKDYFETNKDFLIVVKASHILVDSEEKGIAILDKLNNGEDFGKLAMEESLDSGSKLQGGDLGYFGKGLMIPEFEEAAFSLKEGETSKLVKTEVGYHIIHLVDRKDTYEDLKDDISLVLKENKYKETIQNLRDKAKVKKYLDTKAE